MDDNYYFFDGSALCAQIRTLWKRNQGFVGRKLDPLNFVEYWHSNLFDLNSNAYKRATFYFPKGDDLAPREHASADAGVCVRYSHAG